MSRRPVLAGGADRRTTIQISAPTYIVEAFRRVAERHHISVSSLGRKAVDRILLKHGFDPETGREL
jgi:hypothetical protein